LKEIFFIFAKKKSTMTNVLFVCLGNICRSPAAEGIMKKIVTEAEKKDEFFIDSAGTIGMHQGQLPDLRMRKHALARGYKLDSKARIFKTQDFNHFDYIVAMDDSNFAYLKQKAGSIEHEKRIYHMSDFLSKYDYKEIPDPYYGDSSDFNLVIDLLEDACHGLFNTIVAQRQ
jgi:protein-tyrosine phosphatase